MSGINYIPQYENLTQLLEVIQELKKVSDEGNSSKNNIVKEVDDIITILNKDDIDYNSNIKYTNDFLTRYKSHNEEFKEMMEGKKYEKFGINEQEDELIKQNKRLKEILNEKKKLNRETELVNNEYENKIDVLVQLIQEKKYEDQIEQFEYINDVRMKIEIERAKEWELYEKLLKNEEILFKLNRNLINCYEIFESGHTS